MIRMTEGNLLFAALAGMAGSFLRPGEWAARSWEGSGSEAWHEDVEEEGWCWWSADWLRRNPGRARCSRGSDRVVMRVCGLGERSCRGLHVLATSSSGWDAGEVGS